MGSPSPLVNGLHVAGSRSARIPSWSVSATIRTVATFERMLWSESTTVNVIVWGPTAKPVGAGGLMIASSPWSEVAPVMRSEVHVSAVASRCLSSGSHPEPLRTLLSNWRYSGILASAGGLSSAGEGAAIDGTGGLRSDWTFASATLLKVVWLKRSSTSTLTWAVPARADSSNGHSNVTLLPLMLEGVTPTAPTYFTPPQSM